MKWDHVELFVVVLIGGFLFSLFPNLLMVFGLGLLLGALLIEKVYF